MKSAINFSYLIFLSVVAALGGFLFGYDTAVISGTIAQVSQLFQLDALQQGWYVGCALIGSIVGVLFAGILSDKLGRKLTMVISAVLFSTSALSGYWSRFYCLSFIYIRSLGGTVQRASGFSVSVGGNCWSSRSLSGQLSITWICAKRFAVEYRLVE